MLWNSAYCTKKYLFSTLSAKWVSFLPRCKVVAQLLIFMKEIPETKDITCARCGRPLSGRSVCNCSIRDTIGTANMISANKASIVRLGLYLVAGDTFLLGMIEGFGHGNSPAMIVNFIIALILLVLTSYTTERPVSIAILSLAINLTWQLIFSLLGAFTIDTSIIFKCLCLFKQDNSFYS